jgi:hypothetical protein
VRRIIAALVEKKRMLLFNCGDYIIAKAEFLCGCFILLRRLREFYIQTVPYFPQFSQISKL